MDSADPGIGGRGLGAAVCPGLEVFERVDDAKRAVEPAGVVLAFQMRTREQFCARLGAAAQHVADAVDDGSKPCLRQLAGQP